MKSNLRTTLIVCLCVRESNFVKLYAFHNFNPASVGWVRIVAGKLDVSYAQIKVSSKSRTMYKAKLCVVSFDCDGKVEKL